MNTTDKHKKHPPLTKSSIGKYHRIEWAIYGTSCGKIARFFRGIKEQLNQYTFIYVDADHSDDKDITQISIGKKQFILDQLQEWNVFDDRLIDIPCDVAIVNGNHYTADRQIIILDENKKESLERRIDQLSQVDIVIKSSSEQEIYHFLESKLTSSTKVITMENIDQAYDCLQKEIEVATPKLKALILAGGKSKRMGLDKGGIEYIKGTSQIDRLIKMCESLGVTPYLSKEYEYIPDVNYEHVIKDKLVDMGPFGAILSAMMMYPNTAWLVIACDLPLLDDSTIKNLIEERDIGKFATAYRGADNPFPEPLIAIYEPRSYQRFLSFLSLGYACPRKVLINSDIHEMVIADTSVIMNANTPEQMQKAKDKLSNK